MRVCPGPGMCAKNGDCPFAGPAAIPRDCTPVFRCPYVAGKQFYFLVALVALVILAMSSVAICAVLKGKDGVITGACCGAMSAAVCGVLVGGVRVHRQSDKEE